MAEPYDFLEPPRPGKSRKQEVTPSRNGRSPLILGLILLVVGSILLAANLGLGIPFYLLHYYPFVLIVLGLIGIVAPSRHLSRSGGIWLSAAGAYCLVSEFRLFDLWWTNAWPIFVMAAGCDILFARTRHA